MRGVALLTSELPTVLALDDLDPPDMDIYTPSIVKYPGSDDVYISTFSVYKHFTEAEILDAEPRENDGLMEIQLAVSRDVESPGTARTVGPTCASSPTDPDRR